jgi:cellulose synthase/poly-beta-1,6-N-acetylglucosamine synthase-like glycosyltransferase
MRTGESTTPRISVVLPAWNAAVTIRRAIDSILTQSWSDLELLVVDDGSTDATGDVVHSIPDPRLRWLPGGHTGVAGAMNRGVAEARAPLIARMDADDVAPPRRLEHQWTRLQADALDVVGGRVRIVDADGRAVPSLQRYEEWVNGCLRHEEIAAERFIESPLVNPTVLAWREAFELGCREGDFPEDYDLWLRVIAAGFRCGKAPEHVLDWTDGPDRLTRSCDRYHRAAFDRCRREHLLAGPLRGIGVVNLWGAGETGKPWLRWLMSAGFRIGCAVEVAPRKIGRRIHGVPVIHFRDLPSADGTPLLIAVGAAGAREQITPVLEKNGYRPGKDAWFVA